MVRLSVRGIVVLAVKVSVDATKDCCSENIFYLNSDRVIARGLKCFVCREEFVGSEIIRQPQDCVDFY